MKRRHNGMPKIHRKDKRTVRRYKREWARRMRADPEYHQREREYDRLRRKLITLARYGEKVSDEAAAAV